MSLNQEIIKPKQGTEKSFGYFFTIIFTIIGFYPLLSKEMPLIWSLLVAGILLIVTLKRPSILIKPNFWWFQFGRLLSKLVSPVVMLAIFISTVIPIGLITRLLGKDPLQLKKKKDVSSYWINREDPPQSMKRQF